MQFVWFVVGLLVMYWLDPTLGSSRRRLFLSRSGFVLRGVGGASLWGFRALPAARIASISAFRGRRSAGEILSEDQLLERVQGEIDAVSHPESIAVRIESRRVTLSGPILAREVVTLLRRVSKIPGVEIVNNHLTVKRDSDARFRWLPARRRRVPSDSASVH